MSRLTKIMFVFLYSLFGVLTIVSLLNKEAKYVFMLILPIAALTFVLYSFRNLIQYKQSLDTIKKELKSIKRKEKKIKKKISAKKKSYQTLTNDINRQKKEQRKLEIRLKQLQQQLDKIQPEKDKNNQLHVIESKIITKKKELEYTKKQLNTYKHSLNKIHYLLVQDELRKVDKMTGRQFELYLSKILILNGYQTKVTKASGDQGVDIIAKKNNHSYAIQVKRYKYPVSNHAVQEVFSGKQYYGLQHAVVATNNTFTKSAKELAEKTHVALMDRQQIEQLIENAININPNMFL